MMRMKSFFHLVLFSLLLFNPLLLNSASAQQLSVMAEPEPYRGDYAIKGDQFAIWNGYGYIPVFIKGINLGISVPGTQP